ncbi:MAG: tetratricopeptide repeat protein, partial [Clostridia bacterium]|nr:tetratricopeptide repeat protein [Clostridia bacterium]
EYLAMLNELGGLYRAEGKYAEAEAAFKKAKTGLAAWNDQSPDYATTINNLAGLYRLTGQFAKAEKLFQETLQIYAQTVGKNHFLYSSGLNNLGLLYQDQKRYPEAIALHEEALQIVKKLLFQIVPYATSLNNLANAYRAVGRLDEALNALSDAIQTFEANNCQKHPFYASTLNTLAGVYYDLDRNAEAEKLYRQVQEFYQELYGPYCRECAATSHNLCLLALKKQSLTEAYDWLQKETEAYKHLLGEDHQLYQDCLRDLQRLQAKLEE